MRMRDDPLYKEGKKAARAWIKAGLEAKQTVTAYQAGFDDELKRQRDFLMELYGYVLWTPCCESCPNQNNPAGVWQATYT
jgi:hypothetical protein